MSLATSLALPAGVVEKIFVHSHDLYCKIAPEDYQEPTGDCQVKEALESSAGPEPRDWRFPYIDYALYGIHPDDPKEASAIRRKAPKFYYNAITRTLYVDHMTGSCSAVCPKKRRRRYSKKRMTACMQLINLVQSLGIDSED